MQYADSILKIYEYKVPKMLKMRQHYKGKLIKIFDHSNY